VRDVTNRCGEFQNGTRGLKASSSSPHATRPSKGRSSTVLSAASFGVNVVPGSIGGRRRFSAALALS